MLYFKKSRSILPALVLVLFFIVELVSVPISHALEKRAGSGASRPAFAPGEMLKYEVSWSNMLSAGTAVMEVRQEKLPDGKQVLAFVLNGKTKGVMDRVFPVHDRVESIFDPEMMHSLSYRMSESFGKKKRVRTLVFDRTSNTAVGRLNNEPPRTVAVPARAQDGFASLYYLRSMEDFTVGNVFSIDVHEGGKNWSLEVLTVGRERVKTPAGEFDTIKVRTRPLHEGVFRNKGEAFIWLTDDGRKVPVLMKSSIKVGSFVFSLQNAKPAMASVTPLEQLNAGRRYGSAFGSINDDKNPKIQMN